MKTYLLTIFAMLLSSLSHAQLAPDLARLKQQFDADSAAALKPVQLKYAAQLDALRRTALQRGDARTAVAVEDVLADLRSKSGLPLSALPMAAAATATATAEATQSSNLDELRKRMGGSKWKGEDGGNMTFGADKFVTTSWGARGEWKIVTPHRMTIEWTKGKREEISLDPDLKTLAGTNGVKWHVAE